MKLIYIILLLTLAVEISTRRGRMLRHKRPPGEEEKALPENIVKNEDSKIEELI